MNPRELEYMIAYQIGALQAMACYAGAKVTHLKPHGSLNNFVFATYMAHVAEVEVSSSGAVRVRRVVCAVDCGTVVNPDTVRAQIQSAVIFGITAALHGQITLKDGRVEQSNFHDYEMLRIDAAPAIDVHIVQSSEPPGGMGECGTSAIVPAVANAIFAATGKRLRKMPIDPTALKEPV